MLTHCPNCATTFRVTADQLKVRQGRVRCGHCQEVFNALDTLIEAAASSGTLEPASSPAAAAAPVAAMAAEDMPASETPSSAADPAELPATQIEAVATAIAPTEAPSETHDECIEAAASSNAEHAPAVELPHEAIDEFAAENPPAWQARLHGKVGRRVWPWAVGCAAAVIAFAAQAAVHFRTEISVLYPPAKPALVAVCEWLGCEVALPRKPELIGIEASSLATDADGKLALAATLKNRAPFAQQYPQLELTLTDTGDQPLVRRVLTAADYLPPPTAIAAGFGANAEFAVNLSVAAPDIPAAGYRLYIFYP